MASSKAAKTFSEVVIVDSKDQSKLPEEIQSAYNKSKKKKILPFVIFSDPQCKKIYGVYGHGDLKGDGGKKLFRDVKKIAKADIKAGTFGVASASKNDETEEVSDSIVTVESAEMTSWTSEKGSTIQAKLISVTNETSFLFLTEKGKEITIAAHQLSSESLQKAQELAGL